MRFKQIESKREREKKRKKEHAGEREGERERERERKREREMERWRERAERSRTSESLEAHCTITAQTTLLHYTLMPNT